MDKRYSPIWLKNGGEAGGLQPLFDVRAPVHIDDFHAELHHHARWLGRQAAQHLGHAFGQVFLGLGRAARQQAQLGVHKRAVGGGGANFKAVHQHEAAFEVGLVQHFGAAGDGLVQLGEGLRLGKTGKVLRVFDDQVGHGLLSAGVEKAGVTAPG